MKIIKYNLKIHTNVGTEQDPAWEYTLGPECTMPYSADNMAIAQEEAYGEITVEDNGKPEPEPTTEEILLEVAADHEARICEIELGL